MNREKFEKVESLLSEAKKNLNEAMPDREQEQELEEFEHREAYLEEFNRVCDRFGIEIELEEDDMDKDQIFSDWQDEVNVSASELKKWSKNPCSRQASQEPVKVMKRNLRLLERNKDEWTENDYKDAKRTVSFISRMSSDEMKPDSPRKGPHGCPSEWAISLLNWAYNPFDSIPSPSSEVKDDLDSVEKVTLSSELQEGRRNIKEAEMLAEQVWVMKDVLEEFNQEFQDLAMSLEEEKDIEEVRNKREQVVKSVDLMMSKLNPAVKAVKENPVEELQDSRKASQVVHGDQEKHLGSKNDSEDGSESVRVPPVAIHKVEGGEDNVQVSDDVEQVLDELWDDESEEDEK